MRVGPSTPTTPIARPGRPYGARTSETSCISIGWFSWPMKTRIRPALGDVADELAEVGPVLERREDPPQLVALGELGGVHDVEQAVAEDLLDRLGVVVLDDAHDPLADPAGERLEAVVATEPLDGRLGAGPRSGRRAAR